MFDLVHQTPPLTLQGVTALTQSLTSTTVDMIQRDGPCVALLFLGAVSGTGGPTLDLTIQEGDGTTWTEVIGPLGTTAGTFAQQTTTPTAGTNPLMIQFQRTQRYLRAKQVVGGTTSPSFTAGVCVFSQYKSLTPNPGT